MGKAVLMLLLALASGHAAADWRLVDISNDGTIAAYADPATISKSGYNVKIMTMFNYKRARVVDGKPYLSYQSLDEYDCSTGAMRSVSSTSYAKSMGEGEVVARDSTADASFQPFPNDSLASYMWEFACAKH
ncbi:hypothetical protein GALL_283590 [mine drainage metagenome]|uniref:Surface-adhesin protein E-like domain-containing protein n=1 Tax=mine drainage metagenome TaxID=410659 RepID=A0A1J5RCJ6_9ZZZZ